MFQGFYNLGSEMLCQTRNMNVISNNMANVATAGFKRDDFQVSAFREVMMSGYQGSSETSPAALGNMAMVRSADTTVTDYSQGMFRETENTLDFALTTPGFFCVQTEGGTVYTRNGSFALDEEGYLTLPTVGRVLGQNGPIQLPTDDIISDSRGNIFSADGQTLYGTLSVVDFQNYDEQLVKTTGGAFTAQDAGTPVDADVKWKATEGSNVNPMDEMTAMMSGQRSLQSAAQILKMYDHLMDKTVTQLGPA